MLEMSQFGALDALPNLGSDRRNRTAGRAISAPELYGNKQMDERAATVRFAGFGGLGASEIHSLKALASPPRVFRKGHILRHEGDADPKLYFLLGGWSASSIDVPTGGRQVIKINMPGDMLGVPGMALTEAPDTLTALTPVSVSVIEPRAMGRLFRTNPHIAELLFLISQEERVALMDRLVSIGRTSAINRIAAVVSQLYERLRLADPSITDKFELPLTQSDLADMTGLTVVHVNRTIQKLRQGRILTWVNQAVHILNVNALKELAALPIRHSRSLPVLEAA